MPPPPEARALVNLVADVAPRPYDAGPPRALTRSGFAAAQAEITSWPGYAPTPLLSLPVLARRMRVGELHYKDESGRFGLGSFKALGGAYAVANVLRHRVMPRAGSPKSPRATCCRAHSAMSSARPP